MEGTRGRARLATIVLAAVIVVLLAFIVLSAVLDGTFSAAHLWSATSLMVIILVTAAVGLVVVAAYLAIAVVTVLGTAVAVLQVSIGHHPVLETNGNLASLAQGRTAWAGLVQGVFLLAAAALWLAAVIRQALSWRQLKGAGEVGGERRQQLKWLASGAAVCGVLGISAVSTNSSIWEVLILGFAALPLSIGIGILKYRLYEIDRIISRSPPA